jgi:hypothetical protein
MHHEWQLTFYVSTHTYNDEASMYPPHNSHMNHECFKKVLNMLCDPIAFTLRLVHFVFSFCVHFKLILALPHSFFVCSLYSHKIMYKISQEELGLRKKSFENLHRFDLNGMLPLTLHLM